MRQTRKTMLVTHSRLTHERLKDCYLIHFLIAVLAGLVVLAIDKIL